MEILNKTIGSKIYHRLSKGAYGRYVLKRRARRTPCRVVIGACGGGPPGWLLTEYEVLNLLKPEDWARYFCPGSIDALLSEHVWEHLTEEQGVRAAEVCHKYLKPGGYLRVAVPDGLHPDPQYIEWVRPGGSGPGGEDHKVLYTYCTFRRIFEAAGFEVELLEHFDERSEFHYREWDPEGGKIWRSKRFDPRNRDGKLVYTSLILDAKKQVKRTP